MKYRVLFPVLLICIAAIIWPSSTVSAQDVSSFKHLDETDGLSYNWVKCIFQDSAGFIWLATSYGFNRFDGNDFKVFNHDPLDPGSTISNNVMCIAADSSGMMWLGTKNGLDRFDPVTEQFLHISHDPADSASLSSDMVRTLLVDGEEKLWIGTSKGLDRLDPGTLTLEHVDLGYDSLSTASKFISSLFEDSMGLIWIGTGKGLFIHDPASGRSLYHVMDKGDPTSLKGHFVYSFCEDSAGEIWIGTTDAVNRYDRISGSFIEYDMPIDKLLSERAWVTDIEEDSEGRLWITSAKHSLFILDKNRSQISRIFNVGGSASGLSPGYLECLFRDRDSTMWIGTRDAGLNLWSPSDIRFDLYSRDPGDPASLGFKRVKSVCVDREGYLWVGGNGGLDRIDRKKGSSVRFRKSDTGLRNLNITVVYEDPDRSRNTIWLGTKIGGLHSYDLLAGSITQYSYGSDGSSGLKGKEVSSLVRDKDGILWIGTHQGLQSYDEATGRFTLYSHDSSDPSSLSSNMVFKVFEDSRGDLWVCTIKGINRYDRETGSFVRHICDPGIPENHGHNMIVTGLEGSDGSLWFGTAGTGLSRLDRESGAFEHFTSEQGLSNNFVTGILEDDRGYLWISTRRGLSRFDPDKRIFRDYSSLPKMQSNEFLPNVAYKSEKGELFFGGIEGLNSFDPSEIYIDSEAHAVAIVDFKLNNRSVTVGSGKKGRRILDRTINHTDRLELSHSDDVFSFQFSALHFADPEKCEYAYMLKGLEDEWNLAGNSRFATYSHIPPGKYVFMVRASNSDGVWSDESASIEVVISPPFWKTSWFRTLALLLIVALPLAHFRMVTFRMKRRNRILNETNNHLEIEITQRQGVETALRESEERFRSLVENSPEILYRYSDLRGSLYISPRVENVLGHPLSHFIEDPFLWRESIHPEDRPGYDRAVRDFKIKGSMNTDYRVQDASGRLHWIEDRSISGNTSEGETVIYGIAIDVSELKEAEESLRMTQSAVKSFGDEFYLIDAGMRIRDINNEACEALGYTREELLGMTIFDFNPEFSRERYNALFIKAKEEGDVLFESIHMSRSGRNYPVEVRTHFIEFGEEEFLFGFVRDISERKDKEESLRLTQAAVKNAADGIFWIDNNARFKYVNEATIHKLGYTREELLEMTVSDVDPLWSRERFSEFWDHIRETRHDLIESVHRTKSGEEFPVEVRLSYFEYDGNAKLFAFARDISERKQAEQDLKAAIMEIKDLKDQLEAENILLRREVSTILGHRNIVGESIAMRKIMTQASEVASTSSTVLLMGETGTGKELIARAIHDMSPRKNRPFMAVNCAAIPTTLLESELFGREKGAYTGALTSQLGRFELADRSTIFLDEIGELSLEAQAKLLRILQEGEFERLGSTKTRKIDVRIIAATNRDLEDDVREKIFRNDLYYRLNVFPIQVPPLRDRCDDIPPLIRHFVREFNEKMGKSVEDVPKATMENLCRYLWPGNVRELRNIIERGMILAKGSTLRVSPPKTREVEVNGSKALSLDEVQKKHIIEVLERTGWKVRGAGGAAEILEMKPSTLESRMAKLGIKRPVGSPR